MITVKILEEKPLEVKILNAIVEKEIIPDGYYKIEGTTEITENGTHNVGDYEFAEVNVPERKEEQEATVEITENGTTEIFPDENKVLSKATVNVNVPIPEGYVKPEGVLEIEENGTFDVREKAEVNVQVVPKIEKPYIDSSKLKYGAFMFAASDESFKVTYNTDLTLLKYTDTSEMVDMSYFLSYRNDLTDEILGDYVFNVGNARVLKGTFRRCENKNLTKISITGGTKNCENMYYCFGFLSKVRVIEGVISITEKCTNIQYCFYNCQSLEEVRFDEICLRSNYLSFAESKNLSVESMLSILNALSDNTGLDTTYKVTFGTANLAKLTQEQKEIAYNKNISLA